MFVQSFAADDWLGSTTHPKFLRLIRRSGGAVWLLVLNLYPQGNYPKYIIILGPEKRPSSRPSDHGEPNLSTYVLIILALSVNTRTEGQAALLDAINVQKRRNLVL